MRTIFSILILAKMTGCVPKPEPEMHLIPENYRGMVTIHFAQSAGEEPEHEGRFRVYRIPSDGILETQFTSNLGVKTKEDNLFYLINNDGNRTSLPRFDESGLLPDAIVVSNLYGTSQVYYYFVDELRNIHSYPNPLLDESERNWEMPDSTE